MVNRITQPLDKQIKELDAILKKAKRSCVDRELSELLGPLTRECYRSCEVITDTMHLYDPVPTRGAVSWRVKGDRHRIRTDCLRPQFRWDAVCQIISEIRLYIDQTKNK